MLKPEVADVRLLEVVVKQLEAVQVPEVVVGAQ